MIPLTNVVIDTLHLFLRVDVLINLLIVELRRQDATEKVTKFTCYDPLKYKHCEGFQGFVSDLGIPGYQFYIGQNSKQLKIGTLTGPEKLKVFHHIRIANLPSFDHAKVLQIQWLWTELLHLNETFSKRPEELSQTDIDSYEQQASEWGRRTYQSSNVTPYIHALMNHVSEFMRLHGGILQFTQHGLEKYDIMTKDYFRCTSHHGDDALLQIMRKQNRLEHLRDMEAEASMCFEITCSNCRKPGHNKLSCLEPCKTCQYDSFRGHLVDVNGKKIPMCEQENACT